MSIKINSSVLKSFFFAFTFIKIHSGYPVYRETFAPQNCTLSSTASGPPLWDLFRPSFLVLTPEVWNRIPILAQSTMLAEENIPSQSFRCHMGK